MKIEINGAQIELNPVQSAKVQQYILEEVLRISKDPAQTFRKKGWSEEEEAVLKNIDKSLYGTLGAAFKALESKLGRSWTSIAAKYHDLHSKPHRKTPPLGVRKWTPEEERALIDMEFHPETTQGQSFAAIAHVLGRTPESVMARYYLLKERGLVPKNTQVLT